MTKARSFSTVAHTRPTADDDLPPVATGTGVSTDVVAANPLNKRVVDPESEDVRGLATSIDQHGQLEASAVVTRAAFLAIFPEYERDIGPAVYVQVTGEQRLEACRRIGRDIEIAVKDHLAATRSGFAAATVEENLKRKNLNAVEEAHAVAQVVQECDNNQAAAARQLGYTRAWVNQRLNLLKLSPAVQQLIQVKRVPVRQVRGNLWKNSHEEQLAILTRLIAARDALTPVDDDDSEAAGEPKPKQAATVRPSPIVRAIRRLGVALAQGGKAQAEATATLRSQLNMDARRALAEELLRED